MFIPNYLFTYEAIEKRKPLSPEARRAGWTGCNILLDKIPQSGKIFIVKDSCLENKEKVIQQYERISALQMNNLESRGWILEILKCIESLPEKNFCLQQMYEFEELLHEKYPNNNFIKDKIRQQLQFLRDKNIIEFTSRGHYHSLI